MNDAAADFEAKTQERIRRERSIGWRIKESILVTLALIWTIIWMGALFSAIIWLLGVIL